MSELDTLIQLLAKLPGLGPRSARRAALHLVRRRESLLEPLAAALAKTAEAVRPCPICSNLDTLQPCAICRDPRRDESAICVVEDLADLWALERTGAFRGRYHVLGGTLSALDGIGPDDLRVAELVRRCAPGASDVPVREAILATSPSVEGEATAVYLAKLLRPLGVRATRIATGVPIGGELEYADQLTLARAIDGRREM